MHFQDLERGKKKMTNSMCVSMTGRTTRLQIANEQRRQSYTYYQVAKIVKEISVNNQNEKEGLKGGKK